MKYENDFELAAAYVPHLRYDKAKPFALQGIGYTIYHETAKSPSCRRVIEIPEGKTAIEYAFYYDFDIQHLYDLEHSFVYLDGEGNVTGVESSFHGKFLNSMIEGVLEFDDSHPVLYVQPGKHAFLPSQEYFQLYIERDAACNEKAGSDGFLIMPMFEDRFSADEEMNRKVKEYIRRNYSFVPAWEFMPESPDGRKEEEMLMPYRELDGLIAERLLDWIEKIKGVTEMEGEHETNRI